MAWTAPKVVEVPVGLEINSYACATRKQAASSCLPAEPAGMLRVLVLGDAAGGGVPQWNCGCEVCRAARDRPDLARTQVSVAFSGDGTHWFLINASPDLRQQLNATAQLHPRPDRLRDSPIAGVFLTNAEVDAVAGLLTLREGTPFGLYAHPRVLSVLAVNPIFEVLDRTLVERHEIRLGEPFEPRLSDGEPSGVLVEAFGVPGKPAWYLEKTGTSDTVVGDTIGLSVRDRNGEGAFVFLAACAGLTPAIRARLDGVPLVLFDGTTWHDDELIQAGLGQKTAARMGHMAMAGETGSIAALEGLAIGRRVFVHINNSNPVLLPESDQRRTAEAAGWEILGQGSEIEL